MTQEKMYEFKTDKANYLYMIMLDYFIISSDPSFNVLKKFAHGIRKIENIEDREFLTEEFERNTYQKIGYFLENN